MIEVYTKLPPLLVLIKHVMFTVSAVGSSTCSPFFSTNFSAIFDVRALHF